MSNKPTPTASRLYERISRSETAMLALTGLTLSEFALLATEFAKDWTDYHERYTLEDKPRLRRVSKQEAGALPSIEDKLLFICSYLKAYPIQELHAAIFSMHQSHANVWIHRLAEFLMITLKRLRHIPERNAQALAHLAHFEDGCERLYLDGTERLVQRKTDDEEQKADFSGKKKAHTRENLILCTATQKVVYLGPTYAGSAVDITMSREQNLRLPHGAELMVDLGFLALSIPHCTVLLPHKKPRGGELTQEQKDYNTLFASARVVNEHAISGIKRCRSVKDRFRNWKPGFDDEVMCLASALHNLRVSSRASYKHSPLATAA